MTLIALGGAAVIGLSVLVWQQQHPPLRLEAGPPPPYAQWDAKLAAAQRVDINRAGAEELERLPEVGPSTAQRIIDYRAAHGPFRSAQELLDVPGIGPATLKAIEQHIEIR